MTLLLATGGVGQDQAESGFVTEALDDLGPSDAELIAAVRAGDTAAYGVLYRRHLGVARRVAVALVAAAAEREDLIAEAFTRVLRALRAGWGPATEFRPYLLVALRTAAINSGRRAAMVLYDEMPDALLGHAGDDPSGARIQAGIAADAFSRLPERWQTVLWRTEIEDASPAALAPQWGMTANGVAVLAYRAREGLRQAYLEQDLPAEPSRGCKATVGQLAAWVRKGRTRRRTNRVIRYLARCTGCRELADTLVSLNRGLPTVSTAVLTTASSLTAVAGQPPPPAAISAPPAHAQQSLAPARGTVRVDVPQPKSLVGKDKKAETPDHGVKKGLTKPKGNKEGAAKHAKAR